MKVAHLVLLACAGCGYAPAYESQLSVSPRFTPEASVEVFSAAEQWNVAMGIEVLHPILRECPGDGSRCIEPGTLPYDVIGRTYFAYRSVIDVDKLDLYGLTVQPTALHELGHAMGLVHHPEGTAMAADRHVQAFAPMPDDVAQWRAINDP